MKLKVKFSFLQRKGKKSFIKGKLSLKDSNEQEKVQYLEYGSKSHAKQFRQLEKNFYGCGNGVTTNNETEDHRNREPKYKYQATISKDLSKGDKTSQEKECDDCEVCRKVIETTEKKIHGSSKCKQDENLQLAKYFYPEFFPSCELRVKYSLELKPNTGLEFLGKSIDCHNREYCIKSWLSFFG